MSAKLDLILDTTPDIPADYIPLDDWANAIGEWAAETFPDHTAESIMFHIQEKAVKLGLSTAGIRAEHPLQDAAGLLVLVLTYFHHTFTLHGFTEKYSTVSEWLADEMAENRRTPYWVKDETGLTHRSW